jgi:hypothetical protein
VVGWRYIPEYILEYIHMKKLKDKNIRKILKIGKTSLAVTLPKEMINNLKWKEKQKVSVKKVRGGVLIKDWRK